MRNLLKYSSILVVLIWMLIVFCFSAEVSYQSQTTSSEFTKLIFKNITDEQIENISYIIRKMAHFTLYTLGGICICICVILNNKFRSNSYLISYVIGTGYAITDEFHQLFVPGRAGQIRDVIIDSIGVLLGVIVIKVVHIIYDKIKECD